MTQAINPDQWAAFKQLLKQFIDKHKKIKTENIKLRQVAIYYANSENWRDIARLDRGEKARKTLKELAK